MTLGSVIVVQVLFTHVSSATVWGKRLNDLGARTAELYLSRCFLSGELMVMSSLHMHDPFNPLPMKVINRNENPAAGLYIFQCIYYNRIITAIVTC